MAVKPVLPVPGSDWRSWALQLVQSLQSYYNGDLSVTPIYDGSGRVLVDTDGLYVYDPVSGVELISPSLVQIDTSHLADAAVTTAKIANLSVDNDKLAALAVDAAKLANSAVTSTKIANLAVGSAAIQAAAIGTSHIANAAITSALIGDAEIVEAKIADLAVTDAKINTVTANKIRAGTIGAYLIYLGDGTFLLDGGNKYLLIQDTQATPVERVKIGKLGAGSTDYGIEIRDSSGNIILSSGGTYGSAIANSSQQWSDVSGSGKPSDNATVGAQIGTNFVRADGTSSVGETDLAASFNPISSANISTFISSAAIGSAYIANAAITNAKIANAAVDTAQIADAAITNAKIGSLAVGSANIANGAITNAKIGSAAVQAANIADANITEAKIGSAAVTTLKIGTNAVTVPSSASQSGTASVLSTWTTLASTNWTAAGGKVSAWGGALIDAVGGSVDGNLRIVIGPSTGGTFTVANLDGADSDEAHIPCYHQYTPSSGSVTVSLQAQTNAGTNQQFKQGFLMVVEAKR